jgi:hypothetical protein
MGTRGARSKGASESDLNTAEATQQGGFVGKMTGINKKLELLEVVKPSITNLPEPTKQDRNKGPAGPVSAGECFRG